MDTGHGILPAMETALVVPVPSSSSAIDLPKLLVGFLSRYSPGASQKSVKEALRALGAIVAPGAPLETIPWHELRRPHCLVIRAKLSERHAPKTVNLRLSVLRQLLKEAWRQGLIPNEEFQRATDLDSVRGSRLAEGRCLTEGEVGRMLDATRLYRSPLRERHRAMLALAFACGLRRFELATLDLEGVKADTLTVVRKGNKEQCLPLNEWAKAEIVPWAKIRGLAPGPFFLAIKRGGTLGEGLSRETIGAALAELAVEAKVPDFSPHDTRRTFITRLLEKGTDLSIVQKLAGHSDPKTTALYDKRGEEWQKKAVETITRPDSPKPKRKDKPHD